MPPLAPSVPGDRAPSNEHSERDHPTPWVGVPSTGPRVVLCRLALLPSRLLRYRDLIVASLARERRIRVQGTALGMLWPFLQPLCLFAIYGLLFGSVLGVHMPLAGEWGLSLDWGYGLWLWTGALVWGSFSECISRAVTCIVDQRGLVRKLVFPCEVLPLEIVLSSLITLGIGLLAYLVASIVLLGLRPSPALLWVPVIVCVQAIWMWGLALFCAAMQVWLRDMQHVVGILLSLAMFATPVFWIPAPEVLPGIVPWMGFVHANPLHHLLNAWRGVLLPDAPASCFTATIAGSLAVLVPWALGTFLVGYATFAAGQDTFADEV